MEKLTTRLVSSLVSGGSIAEDDRDIYEYGLNIVFLFALNFAVVAALGIAFSVVVELALFYIAFNAQRSASGGYHAKSFWTCTISSALIMAGAVLGIKFLPTAACIASSILLAVFSVSATFKYAPVANENRPLSEIELVKFRKLSKFIVVFAAAVSVTLICLRLERCAFGVALGGGVSGFALLLSVALDQNKHNKEIQK